MTQQPARGPQAVARSLAAALPGAAGAHGVLSDPAPRWKTTTEPAPAAGAGLQRPRAEGSASRRVPSSCPGLGSGPRHEVQAFTGGIFLAHPKRVRVCREESLRIGLGRYAAGKQERSVCLATERCSA